MRDQAPLPVEAPELPAAVTHVWSWSGWTTGDAFCWSEAHGWQLFSKMAQR